MGFRFVKAFLAVERAVGTRFRLPDSASRYMVIDAEYYLIQENILRTFHAIQ
jgi:hypothetical protein